MKVRKLPYRRHHYSAESSKVRQAHVIHYT